jgi:dTMP kinase
MGGMFVSFEGPDGSGKSTHIRMLADELAAQGFNVKVTREPGGCRISEKIRDIVLNREYAEMSPMAEALLYAASRAQHVAEVIRPALDRGEIVITDRYVDSSIAYQGCGRGLGEDLVAQINAPATGGLLPDLTFFLSVDTKETERRMSDREHDRLEMAGEGFHGSVYDAFKRIAGRNPERFVTIDATRPKQQVHRAVMEAVSVRLKTFSLSAKFE